MEARPQGCEGELVDLPQKLVKVLCLPVLKVAVSFSCPPVNRQPEPGLCVCLEVAADSFPCRSPPCPRPGVLTDLPSGERRAWTGASLDSAVPESPSLIVLGGIEEPLLSDVFLSHYMHQFGWWVNRALVPFWCPGSLCMFVDCHKHR